MTTMKVTENENCWAGPLANVIRSVYYDDRKEPYYTEYQLLDPAPQELGNRSQITAGGGPRIALVTGIRPDGAGEAIARRLSPELVCPVAWKNLV
jgi:hypothetical protein